jgi:hypothetical protein
MVGMGISDLTNGSVVIKKDARTLELTALDDCWHGRPIVPPFRTSKDVPHVTISHEPDVALDFRPGDTDLMICGHTHGGQIRLPVIGTIAGLPTYLGRKADNGRKIINGIPIVISGGCGETDLRPRLFCPPEITVVEVGI